MRIFIYNIKVSALKNTQKTFKKILLAQKMATLFIVVETTVLPLSKKKVMFHSTIVGLFRTICIYL